jgi:triacylglycerol esterase/lipase EstA (alpha/beta hydrolase family)
MLGWGFAVAAVLFACGQPGSVASQDGRPALAATQGVQGPTADTGMSRDVPVVMVAGIFDTGAKMIPVDEALARRGYTRRYRVDLVPSDGTVSLTVLAGQLKEATDKIRRETQAPRLNLVAFSMGAIVSRYYLQEMGGVLQTAHFVSISAPHHGTLMGYTLKDPAPREMRPGSEFMNNLNAHASILETIPCLSLWTPFDAIIVPARSSVVPWAKNISVGALVHPGMLVHKRVHDEIDRWLISP